MMFWPGVDPWPPSKKVWGVAAILTFVVTPIAMLLGTVGYVILGVIVGIALWAGAKARLKKLNAEEFWNSSPRD